MGTNEKQYLDLCRTVLDAGSDRGDRTGTGTRSIFGHQMKFDLNEGFPLLTTKRVPFKLIVSELLWFLKGDTNIRYLLLHNNNIWNEWAFKNWVESEEYEGPDMKDFGLRAQQDEAFNAEYQKQMKIFKEKIIEDEIFAEKFGHLGDVYGKQWRDWKDSRGQTIDQISDVIENIKTKPESRRLIVSAWNPPEIESMALPPCHTLFQFYVNDGKLSCQLYQRSADIFLGVPFNIASYALLTHLIAHECGLEVGTFVHTLGDAHIYHNHFDQVKEQLQRDIKSAPSITLNGEKDSVFDFDVNDITLNDYHPHPSIKAPIAV